MKANPNKFQFMVFTPGTADPCNDISLNVADSIIKNEEFVKLFGVILDRKLTFTQHIDGMCHKSARQVNVLKRLSFMLDYKSKVNIYVSFIKSNFLYCSNVWYFCGVVNMKKILNVEKRCLRFIHNDYHNDYTTMLNQNNMLGLQYDLFKILLTEVYKCINNFSPVYLCERFNVKKIEYNLRDQYKCVIPKVMTVRHGINSFVFYGSSCWNKLASDIKQIDNIYEFQKALTFNVMSDFIEILI
jgi:hypothetical protein